VSSKPVKYGSHGGSLDCGEDAERAWAILHLSKSRMRATTPPLQRQSRHAAPTNTCTRPRIDSDIYDFHRTLHPRPRCPPRGQWHRRTRPSPFLRKTLCASSPRTSQRRERWAWKAVGSEEEWRYVFIYSTIPLPPHSVTTRDGECNGRQWLTIQLYRRVRNPRQHHLPPTRHRMVPR
jgi:hypothetical protein